MKHSLTYTRVSTEEQAKEGRHSLAAQRRICNRVASELGYEIVAIFEDPGKSGTNMNRPGLQDMLIRCQEDPGIEAIFVQDSDRLARNTHDHLTIKTMLAKRGIRIVSASQPMIEESAEGQMIDTIIASVNQFQSDITARKTLKGLQEKVRNGGWPRPAPLGYDNVERKGEKVVVPNAITAPLIQRLFQMYATGKHSLAVLRDHLHKQGLRSRTGKKLPISKVHAVLRNPFYIGRVHWGGIKTKGRHEPIIDPDLFQAVNNVLSQKRHFSSRARKHQFLLSGLIKCGNCNGLYIAETHPRKHKSYYRCHKPGGCDQCFDAETAAAEVGGYMNITFSNGFVKSVLHHLRRAFKRFRSQLEAQKRGLVRSKVELESKRKKVEDRLLDGSLPSEDFHRIRTEIQKELDRVDEEVAVLGRRREFRLDVVEEVLNLVNNLPGAYERAPVKLKRLYLALFWQCFVAKRRRVFDAKPSRLLDSLLTANHAFAERLKPASPVRPEHIPNRPAADQAFLSNTTQTQNSRHPAVRIESVWGPNCSVVRPFIELISDLPYLQGLIAQLREIRLLEKVEGLERSRTRFAQASS